MISKHVYLNIYNLHPSNYILYYFGCGFYHTTLVIGTKEFDYGPGTGIDITKLEDSNNLILREKIYIGFTDKTYEEIYDIIDEMSDTYSPFKYDPFKHNCHNFIIDLSKNIIDNDIEIYTPYYISRFKYFCCCFSCLFPRHNDILQYLRIQ